MPNVCSYTTWSLTLMPLITAPVLKRKWNVSRRHACWERNAASGLFIKWKINFQKWFLWTLNDPTRMTQGRIPLAVSTADIHCRAVHFSRRLPRPRSRCAARIAPRCSLSLHAGKGKCCMWPVNKVENHFEEEASQTANGPI